MYGVIKQQLKNLSKEDYEVLKELSRTAKNLTNQAIYNARQHYFATEELLSYNKNYHLLKNSENYKILNSNMAQQTIKVVDSSFKSFFELTKLAKKGEYDANKVRLPKYLPKDGYATLVIGDVRFSNNGTELILPYSRSYKKSHQPVRLKLPPVLQGKTVKEIRIIPKAKARYFEVHYIYKTEIEPVKLDKTKALGIDFGVNNLATCVTNTGQSFIVDGKRLKSINQWYNKRNAKLQSIKDKQELKGFTTSQYKLLSDRNNKVNDYMLKTARLIINHCIDNEIGVLVCGVNKDFQYKPHLGKVNNQTFVNIPFGQLRRKLAYLCERYGITYVEQEESYTSKASFFDNDIIPTYNKNQTQEFEFSGKRVKRGLYRTSKGYTFNADCNGALNILSKSNRVSLTALSTRGELDTPVRIRVV